MADGRLIARRPRRILGGVVNGKLYVFGGFQNGPNSSIIALTRSYVYDPTTNTWTRIADEPEAMTHAGVVVDGTTFWFIAPYVGDSPGPGSTDVWKYDTLTNTWSAGPSLPVARGGNRRLIGRQIHFVGGTDITRMINESDHFMLDLDNQDAGWQTLAPMPNARNNMSGAASTARCTSSPANTPGSTRSALSEVDCYDPATDPGQSRVDAGRDLAHEFLDLRDGWKNRRPRRRDDYNTPQTTIYAYDPILDTCSLIGTLPANRSTSVAGVLSDGTIITTTGNNPNPMADTWIGTLPTT